MGEKNPEKQGIIENQPQKPWMEQLSNAIEKNKNKDILDVAFKLFDKWMDHELHLLNLDQKDKAKVVLWNILMEKMSVTGAVKNGLNWFTNKLAGLKDIFSLKEDTLSEEKADTVRKIWSIPTIDLASKLEWHPQWELLLFLKNQIPNKKILNDIQKLDNESRDKLLNAPKSFENLLKKWLKPWDNLVNYIQSSTEEPSFENYLEETIKETQNRWKTLWGFKKIISKTLDLADKFWMKDSLVWMLEMMYKIPWIWMVLRMMFSDRIKWSLDRWWVNWPEAESTYMLQGIDSESDDSKKLLWFNPAPIPESKDWKTKQNPEAITKDNSDLKIFYTKIAKYNSLINSEENKNSQQKKVAINIADSHFWVSILTGRLNKNTKKTPILQDIHKELGGAEKIKKINNKDDFLQKLVHLDLDNLIDNTWATENTPDETLNKETDKAGKEKEEAKDAAAKEDLKGIKVNVEALETEWKEEEDKTEATNEAEKKAEQLKKQIAKSVDTEDWE